MENFLYICLQTNERMKRTRLFLIGAMAITVTFASCGYDNGKVGKEQLYNNATFVDTEGFTFLKTAHEKAAYELAHAQYALNQGVSGEAQALAEKIVATYTDLLPELDELGAEKQVIANDPGAFVFNAEAHYDLGTEASTLPAEEEDTAETPEEAPTVTAAAGFDQQAYLAHVQKEQAEILNQFERASRNTDKDLRKFAVDRLDIIKEIYTLAGGQVDEGAHH